MVYEKDETISISLIDSNYVSVNVKEYENIGIKIEETDNIKTILTTSNSFNHCFTGYLLYPVEENKNEPNSQASNT
jgi:hypothetical protein